MGIVFIVGSLLCHGVVAWAMPQQSPPPEPPPEPSTVAFTVAPKPEPEPVIPEPEPPTEPEPESPRPREQAKPRPQPKQPQPEQPQPEQPQPEQPQGDPREQAEEPEEATSPDPAEAPEQAIQTVRPAKEGLAVARPEGDGSGKAAAGVAAGEPEVEKGPREGATDAPPGLDTGALRRSYMRRLMATLSRHRRYPAAAERARMEGLVLLSITIDPGGVIADVRIARSSGQGLLDRAALQTVRRLRQLPQPPAGLAARQRTHEVTVPLAYRLLD